jgi:hypothetical protein
MTRTFPLRHDGQMAEFPNHRGGSHERSSRREKSEQRRGIILPPQEYNASSLFRFVGSRKRFMVAATIPRSIRPFIAVQRQTYPRNLLTLQ